jgi:hypothetical protein
MNSARRFQETKTKIGTLPLKKPILKRKLFSHILLVVYRHLICQQFNFSQSDTKKGYEHVHW